MTKIKFRHALITPFRSCVSNIFKPLCYHSNTSGHGHPITETIENKNF